MARPKSNISPSREASNPSSPIHDTMDTLVQGISQQPSHLRLPGRRPRSRTTSPGRSTSARRRASAAGAGAAPEESAQQQLSLKVDVLRHRVPARRDAERALEAADLARRVDAGELGVDAVVLRPRMEQ